jgi:two-component system NtrC family sensor kinase
MNETSHILLVEDSRTQAVHLSDTLSRQGWTVEWVSTAEAAMQRINQPDLDLIVLDYYLPGVQGDVLCQRIRLNTDARGLPILMLTAEDTRTAEVHLLESGADDFVAKSADEEILVTRIRALLAKSPRHLPMLGRGEDSHIRPARILTIDDSPTYQEYLLGELESEGYCIEQALNAREGLARVMKENFDCVIVDLVMPDMNGIEVCRQISELRRATNNLVAVLMLTGRENKEDLTQALEAGADDFISKSSDLAVLKGRIRALLRRKMLQAENRRILEELKNKEVETLRARAEKEVAEAKARLNEELELRVKQRTAELAAANRDLATKSQENEMFVYSVSHDLRSPLVNLQGFSKELSGSCAQFRTILDEQPLPASIRDRCIALVDGEMGESIRFIQTAVSRLSTNIDSLLRLSRVGRIELQWQEVDVNAIVARIIESMNDTIGKRGARLIAAELPPVWGDPSAVEQIFANLIGNAVNYLDPQRPGLIEVGGCSGSLKSTGSTGGASPNGQDQGPPNNALNSYFVRDNGLGIGESYAKKIFQIFQRLHPTVAQGEGMGLAIVRRVTQRLGGQIWFDSAAGSGTTFYVTLPAVTDTPNDENPAVLAIGRDPQSQQSLVIQA